MFSSSSSSSSSIDLSSSIDSATFNNLTHDEKKKFIYENCEIMKD